MKSIEHKAKGLPLVSIAMTVYNGAQFLQESIHSLLAQDYPNFELIICDNGSQDRSEEICRSYADFDPRITFYRNSANINPLENAVELLERSSGAYHMWAADHDLYHPKFISRLVALFESSEDAVVLCFPDTCRIDVGGKSLGIIGEDVDTRGLSPVSRFKKVMWGLTFCTPVYGLYRSSALRKIWKARTITGPDRVVLPELSLEGEFARYPEPLFYMRQNRPAENFLQGKKRQIEWLVPNEFEALVPVIMRDHELIEVVRNAELDISEKDELIKEIICWHRAEPRARTKDEVRHLIAHGMKNLNSIDVSPEEKQSAAVEYFRISQICKIFRPSMKAQLEDLESECRKYFDGPPCDDALDSDAIRAHRPKKKEKKKSMTQTLIHVEERPMVSIGMTVFNAQRFVAQTIESLLAQDHRNFELIISDNGSQDRSGEICRDYAKRDPRIIYCRNETNIHPLKNAIPLLNRGRGEYFMWAADHDVYHPKFISSLVDVFNHEDESLVLAYPDSCQINVDNKPMQEIVEDVDTRGLPAAQRFKKVLWGISCCTPIYGLYRTSVLKKAQKIRWVIGPDLVFLPEFSLMGPFARHRETLFFWRQNRPDENGYEMNQRQAEWFVQNEIEKYTPAIMRDYELLMVVQNSTLHDKEKEELFFEIRQRHRALPDYKLFREVRHLLHEGTKLFTSDSISVEKKRALSKDFWRVAEISKIFCREYKDQLDDLCELSVPYMQDPSNALPVSKIDGVSTGSKSATGFEMLIPPEIKNDAFFEDIKRYASQENIEHILEIGSSSGQGSTSAFVSGMEHGKNKAKLYCMEVSKPRYEDLAKRYAQRENVICYQASSVPLDKFPHEDEIIDFYQTNPTALNNYPIEQVLDWLQADKSYLLRSKVRGNGVRLIKQDHGIRDFDIVLIDGSEFTGRAELDEVYGAKVIMLDDINSFKNYHNYHRLKDDPAYQLEKENWRLRNGYAIFLRKADSTLPIHFFTIVLNGEPFIRHHLERFQQLNVPWHWHIIEGVADLKHDTAWSLSNGGRIADHYHDQGISNDGTSAYLDHIAHENPDTVTLYRKPNGSFWDGKLEMVNAPLVNLPDRCLLWQIDTDELWESEQIKTAHQMFEAAPERTAAFFHCHFFVGPDLVTTTTDTYSHNTAYEWIRLWRYEKGMQWQSHEPPRLMQQRDTQWVDLSRVLPFTHQETEAAGLVFSHYAYALASQVRFKEDYYGYKGAVRQWQMLQEAETFPVRLSSYFGWVRDDTMVNRIENRTIGSAVPPVKIDHITAADGKSDRLQAPHIVIDGVIFQLQAGRSQGISRVWSNLMPELACQFPEAGITVLQRQGFPVPISGVEVRTVPAYQLGSEAQLDADDEMMRQVCCDLNADVFLSTYYTRAPGVVNVVMIHDLIPEKFGFDLSQPEWFAKQRAIETGDAFMCVSGVTRDDLLRFYPRAIKAATVIMPNGLDAGFHPVEPTAVVELRQKLGISKDYFLLVGNRQGYKNVAAALKTLSELDRCDEFCVLCVGGEKQLSGEERSLNRKLDMHYAGQLSDSELAAAYSGARALLVPSKYEGFGLPVIEAMACNCPVIAEKSPAVVEIGGDAAVYADMACTQSVYQALGKVSDPALRQAIIARGNARAARFSWAETAGKMAPFIKALTAQKFILLTAIVSTYNAERFIKGCLQDLAEQSIGDKLEIIVVDSASEEGEAAIVRDFQGRYPNIKYMRTSKRENVYRAWNRGIKFALGKYVTNANTDDRHRRDAYEVLVGALECKDDIALVYADVIKTQTANETFRKCTPTGVFRWPDWDRTKLLEKGCFIGPQPVWRKAVHHEYGYFDERYKVSADFEFWLRISQTNDFYHISKPLGLYMDRPDSIEHANGSEKAHEDQEIFKRYRVAAEQQKRIGIQTQSEHHRSMHIDPPLQDGPKTYNVSKLKQPSTNETITQGEYQMTSPETIIKAIEYLVDIGQNGSALWVMEKLLTDFPDNARLHNELATMAYEQADTSKALEHFTKAVDLDPQNAAFLKNLADYYYVVEKDVQNALAHYERVLNIDQNHLDSLIMAGHLSIAMHCYAQGRQYYQRALDLNPHNPEVQQIMDQMSQPTPDQSHTMSADDLYVAAVKKTKEGDRDQAVLLLEQILARDDRHALAHNDLGVLQYENGNMQEALAHYEKAAALQPENDTFQKNLADFYLAAMGDHALALKTFIQVLKLNPQDVEATLGCGQVCMGLGRRDDARDFINTALTIEPWNENAQSLLNQLQNSADILESGHIDLYKQGKNKASKGDLPGAIADLSQYLTQHPDNANVYNDLGILYFETGEKEKAVSSYEQAVQLDPKDRTFRKNLADFYLIEQGRIEEAMKLYLGVLEDNHQDIEALIACGVISTSVGQFDDAKLFYHRVLEIEPWNETARKALNGLAEADDEQSGNGYDTAAAS